MENESNNQITIRAYEGYARQYAAAVSQDPSEETKEGLRQLLSVIGRGGNVLEIGSGPGWDADFAESLGMIVRRTDVTQSFREFQTERGKQIAPVNVINDDLGGPYDAVMAMCVLLNIDRDLTDGVLQNVADALRPGGAFLLSIREGEGDIWERSELSGDYHVVLWNRDVFVAHLKAVGLHVTWETFATDSDGDWLTFLAQKNS